MFSRKNYEVDEGIDVPQEWKESVASLLNQNFGEHCESQNKSFDIYGRIYQDELLVVISWSPNEDFSQAPTTLFLSGDLFKKEDAPKILDHLVDITGAFYDEFFSVENWNEYEPNWKETKHEGNEYYYKITRENIALSFEADKLLKEDTQKNQ
jgi:hypothetical protein